MAESKKRKFFEVDENEDDSVKASNYGKPILHLISRAKLLIYLFLDKDPGSFLRFYRSLASVSCRCLLQQN